MPPVLIRAYINAEGFLSSRGTFSKDDISPYLSAIANTLLRNPSANLTKRFREISASATFRYWWDTDRVANGASYFMARDYCADVLMGPILRRLDKLAFDLLEHINDDYAAIPVITSVPKATDDGSTQTLSGLCDRFNVTSCADNETPIQTIVGDPGGPRMRANHYRIDREARSTTLGVNYWLYRIQEGTLTCGGMYMQTGVVFVLANVQQALKDSLNADPGAYKRLAAPAWLTGILAAPD